MNDFVKNIVRMAKGYRASEQDTSLDIRQQDILIPQIVQQLNKCIEQFKQRNDLNRNYVIFLNNQSYKQALEKVVQIFRPLKQLQYCLVFVNDYQTDQFYDKNGNQIKTHKDKAKWIQAKNNANQSSVTFLNCTFSIIQASSGDVSHRCYNSTLSEAVQQQFLNFVSNFCSSKDQIEARARQDDRVNDLISSKTNVLTHSTYDDKLSEFAQIASLLLKGSERLVQTHNLKKYFIRISEKENDKVKFLNSFVKNQVSNCQGRTIQEIYNELIKKHNIDETQLQAKLFIACVALIDSSLQDTIINIIQSFS